LPAPLHSYLNSYCSCCCHHDANTKTGWLSNFLVPCWHQFVVAVGTINHSCHCHSLQVYCHCYPCGYCCCSKWCLMAIIVAVIILAGVNVAALLKLVSLLLLPFWCLDFPWHHCFYFILNSSYCLPCCHSKSCHCCHCCDGCCCSCHSLVIVCHHCHCHGH